VRPTIDLYFFELSVYSALVMLGVVGGLSAAYFFLRVRSRRAASLPRFLDGALVVGAAGWLGARAYHVATHWDYYAARPEEIAQVGLGGLALRGAVIAGFIALAVYARARRLRLARLADAAAVGLCVGQAIGWAGALAQGANYGVVSDSRLALDLPDLYGLIEPRFPLQHAEIGLFVSLLVGLLWIAIRQPRAGTLFLVYLLIASAAHFALGFQRGDETLFVGNWRIDQVIDAALAVSALALLLRQTARREETVGMNERCQTM